MCVYVCMCLYVCVLGDMALTRHFLRIYTRPTLWLCSEYWQGRHDVSTPMHALFKLSTSFDIGALPDMPCRAGTHATFWSRCRHHCWFPSTAAWERESSGRATLRGVFLWGWRLPLLTATWIAGALKPLLLSISNCNLRSTRCIPYHVCVPVLWSWSCRWTRSPRCQQPSPCWRRLVGPVTHTAITCQVKVSLHRTSYFLLTGHLSAHIFSVIRWYLNCGLFNHNALKQ